MTKTKAVQIQEYAQGYRKGELRRVSAQLKWLSTALDQAERRGRELERNERLKFPKPTKKKFNIKKFVKAARKVRKTFTDEEIAKFQRGEP